MKRGLAVLVAAALLAPAMASAEVPAKLGYQGRILKGDGTPESGVLQLSFSLFGATTGGSALWSESQNVGLTDGFYSVSLGEAASLPLGLFDGRELYLEVAVGSVPLTPRQRLASVAFALTAANLQGGSVDAASIKVGGQTVVDSSGKLTATAYKTGAGSGLGVGSDDSLTLTTACSAGQILKWSGSAWECSADGGNTYTAGTGLELANGAFSLVTRCASGEVLKWTGSAWECSVMKTYKAGPGVAIDGETVSLLPGCAVGQIPGWTGSTWACTDVTSSPSMQSVAISNLLKNGDVELWTAGEKMPEHWSDYGSAATRSVAKAAGYFQSSSVKVYDGDLNATAALQQVVYASAPPSLAGQLVTLSVWSKWSAGVAAGKICVADAGPDESESSITCQKLASAAGSSAWAKTVVTHTVSGSPAYLKVQLHPTTTAGEGGAYLFDGAMLVLGTFQGNYSPNITEQLYEGGIPSSKLAGIEAAAPLSGKGTPSAPLSLPAASTTQDGFLKATDFATFANAKVNAVTAKAPLASSGGTNPEISIASCPSGQILRYNGTAWACSANVTSVSANAPLSVTSGETPTLTLPKAASGQDGYLSGADWATFNGKVSSVSASAPLVSSGGTTPSLSIPQANASTSGFLSSTDWNNFANSRTHVEWGNTSCASGVSALYTGHLASMVTYGYYNNTSSGPFCLDSAVGGSWSAWSNNNAMVVRPTGGGNRQYINSQIVTCAVCPGAELVVWGNTSCPSGWSRAYAGHVGGVASCWNASCQYWGAAGDVACLNDSSWSWSNLDGYGLVWRADQNTGSYRGSYYNTGAMNCAVCYR